MNLIAAALYDPAGAVSKATSALLAMTAFDTTNLRLAVTVPAHGMVHFKLRCNLSGATTMPQVLLGVLNGATVVGRQVPRAALPGTALATTNVPLVAEFTATGLTPGSINFDAAYAVETVVAATNIHYGGPNNTTANDAWGAFSFEAYDPRPLKLALDGGVNTTQFNGTNATATAGRPEVNTTHAAGTAWGSGAITAASIAADAITSAKIADGAIDAATLATGTITAAKFAAGAIDAAAIADGAIDAATLASGTITAAKFAAGAIDATAIADGAIDAATLATGTITAAKFAAGAIDAAAIATNAIDADSIAADAGTEIGTAVWATTTRLLTAGTNIVLAKGTGVTGFNDLSAAQVNAEADTALVDVGLTTTITGRVDATVSSRLASASYTAPDNATIAAIATYVDTEVAAIKDKTDQLVFTKAGQLDVNTLSVNGVTLTGNGTTVPMRAA